MIAWPRTRVEELAHLLPLPVGVDTLATTSRGRCRTADTGSP